ncbi:MAG TPA: hypothetical protein VGD37_02650 [Kofleriaceae bacterium]
MRNLLLLLALVAACGGDDKKTVDAAPPADVAIDTATVALTCQNYCTQVMTNCTAANAQYSDMAHCLGSCATFPVGTSTANDSTGNTLGCRTYHSGAPAVANAALHCPHAGPPGEAIAAASPGFCSGGDLCATFCAEQIKTCGSTDAPISIGGTAITPQYKNQAACESVCKNGDPAATPTAIAPFDKTHPYGPTASGASLACRFNHWTNAASNAAAGNAAGTQQHCNHSAPQPTGPCAGTAMP